VRRRRRLRHFKGASDSHLITSSVCWSGAQVGKNSTSIPKQTLGKMLGALSGTMAPEASEYSTKRLQRTLCQTSRDFSRNILPPAPSRAGARITIELAPLRTGSRSPGQRERRETASEGENSSRMDLRMGFWSTRRMNRWDGANTARGRSFPVSTTTPAIDDLPVKAAQ